MTHPNSLIRTNIFLSRAEKMALKKIAAKRGISAALLTRQVLDAFLGIEVVTEPVVFKNQPPAK